MSANLIPASIATAHQLGLLLLLGSLSFVLMSMLPAIAEVRSPRLRLRLRRRIYRRMFRWAWLGLVLWWVTALLQLAVSGAEALPPHVPLMALLSLVFTLLLLFAQFALQLQVVVALEDGNSERAGWLLRWLSRVLVVALLLILAVAVLDVAGPALIDGNLWTLLAASAPG